MFMINCYSVELTYTMLRDLSDEQIMDLCTFEYGVQVTEETYVAIQPRRVRIIPMGFFDGVEKIKAFYFGKQIVVDERG